MALHGMAWSVRGFTVPQTCCYLAGRIAVAVLQKVLCPARSNTPQQYGWRTLMFALFMIRDVAV